MTALWREPRENRPRNNVEQIFRQKRTDGALKVKLSIKKQLPIVKLESKQQKREWLVYPNVRIAEIIDAVLLI